MENSFSKLQKILTTLRRYTFDDKCRICQLASASTMGRFSMSLSDSQPAEMFPWDVETFFTLSIAAKEWAYNSFDKNNISVFFNIMNDIHQFQDLALTPFLCSPQFESSFYSPLCSQQYEVQETIDYKLFRYNYIFNFQNENIDMRSIFYNKFNCPYSDFQLIAIVLWLQFQIQDINPNHITTFFATNFQSAFSNLLISRDNYLEELDKITTNVFEYYLCFKPSFKYSFINFDKIIYFPLPHLIVRNCTTSLLHRLTDLDNPLKDRIGKFVLEQYLYDIILDSGVFDEVHPEVVYKQNGTNSYSSDVLTRCDDDFLFLECKSLSPKINVRLCNEISIKENIERLAQGCVQLYNQLTVAFPYLFNPFVSSVIPNEDNVWGLLVVLEDSYLERSLIYARTAELLNLSSSSKNYKWLTSHIGIVPLYSVERYCFTKTSLIDNLKSSAKSGFMNANLLFGKILDASIKSELVIRFRQELKQTIHDVGKQIGKSSNFEMLEDL